MIKTQLSPNKHTLSKDHKLDWDGTKIFDIEHRYHTRLMSEMIYIHLNNNSNNIQK